VVVSKGSSDSVQIEEPRGDVYFLSFVILSGVEGPEATKSWAESEFP
jgi:hypothetical protein